MTPAQFAYFAQKLGGVLGKHRLRWFIAVWPDGEDPQSAANMRVQEQIDLLRDIADALEDGAAVKIVSTVSSK